MLTEEEDAKGKDRGSLGTLDALDGAYMHFCQLPCAFQNVHNWGVCG
jgi:hypothetical protein